MRSFCRVFTPLLTALQSLVRFLASGLHSTSSRCTGASTGFGYYLACHALDNGDTVVATMRNPVSSAEPLTSKYTSQVSNGKLLTLKLDVTNAQEIADMFKATKEKYGRIDVVFNNAGWAIIGEFEGIPEDKARALFDVRIRFHLADDI